MLVIYNYHFGNNMKPIRLGPPIPKAIPDQFRIDIPSSAGQGGVDIISFTSGIQLMIVDTQFKQPTLFQGIVEQPAVGFGFCLNGTFNYQPAGIKHPFKINAGDSGFFSFPKRIEAFEKANSKQNLRIYLMLDGEHLFKLFQGDENRFYPILKSLEKKTPNRTMHTITPAVKAVLHQLLHCPYHGATRQIFLESKVMELMAHKLEQLCPGNGYYDYPMQSSDIERMHHAAHLLVQDLNNPPDIMTLGHSVGLNRDKLHRCFRKVFGLSPFEFLRNHRLQTAMLLLQDGEVNVTQAALMVGYSNISHFAKVFKLKFGITPRELRKTAHAHCLTEKLFDLKPGISTKNT